MAAIGYDGLWTSPESHTIIAEVKTTDAYRLSLDTLATYRQKLIGTGKIGPSSSILIIVGRQDTGDLEAQIRGSRHAWDVRLISADALIKLVQLKEDSDGPETDRKIRSLLTPMEYTRLDGMIDIMFTTAKDVEAAVAQANAQDSEDDDAAPTSDEEKSGWEFTNIAILDAKRAEIISALSENLGAKLIKKSRALFWDASHEARIACSISKRYTKRSGNPYWYAYHPQWDEFLQDGKSAYFVLGCMDLEFAFAIPLNIMRENLPGLNTTTTERSTYWHIHLAERQKNDYALLLPKLSKQLPLADFRVALPSKTGLEASKGT